MLKHSTRKSIRFSALQPSIFLIFRTVDFSRLSVDFVVFFFLMFSSCSAFLLGMRSIAMVFAVFDVFDVWPASNRVRRFSMLGRFPVDFCVFNFWPISGDFDVLDCSVFGRFQFWPIFWQASLFSFILMIACYVDFVRCYLDVL